MEPWQHHFRNVMNDGEMMFSEGDATGAEECFRKAFRLVPEPKNEHSEGTEAVSGIGECQLALDFLDEAEQTFRDVLLFPGAPASSYIRLKRAEVYLRLGDPRKARTEITCAYLNDGLGTIFQTDLPDLREIIRDVHRELSETTKTNEPDNSA